MECPHGEPRGEIYCPFCRNILGIKFVSPNKRKPVESNSVRVSARHPDTSHIAGARALPKSGTKKKLIYDLIVGAGSNGMCDHELEIQTGFRHESVSATRNYLMNDGWIVDSGKRRQTPQGNPAIVWVSHDSLTTGVLF
jgi:hypothetical protein